MGMKRARLLAFLKIELLSAGFLTGSIYSFAAITGQQISNVNLLLSYILLFVVGAMTSVTDGDFYVLQDYFKRRKK
jgi:hypothetical protein